MTSLPWRRLALTATCCALLFLSAPTAAFANKGMPRHRGPRPRPKAERTDAELYEKALRIQARMWKHISPEGLLVYEHRVGATPDELSHDAMPLSDVAMWTGSYAAAQACRWHVTRDPDALTQVRVLARGLALLNDATGVPGRLSRTVGRPLPGQAAVENLMVSPLGNRLHVNTDVSRDQLAGIVLGWAAIARYVDDPELMALARTQVLQIAHRLYDDGMWLRGYKGVKTRHGELRPNVDVLPMIKNGGYASIGYAPLTVATSITTDQGILWRFNQLKKQGWRGALSHMNINAGAWRSASNINMVHTSTLAILLHATDARTRSQAFAGMNQLSRVSRGWWNGGMLAMQLLAGITVERRAIEDELRVVLHMMSEDERPPARFEIHEYARIATIRERGVYDWAWKARGTRARIGVPGSGKHPSLTYTRADWLFAYWLAREAGALKPERGGGAGQPPHLSGIETPAWVRSLLGK